MQPILLRRLAVGLTLAAASSSLAAGGMSSAKGVTPAVQVSELARIRAQLKQRFAAKLRHHPIDSPSLVAPAKPPQHENELSIDRLAGTEVLSPLAKLRVNLQNSAHGERVPPAGAWNLSQLRTS